MVRTIRVATPEFQQTVFLANRTNFSPRLTWTSSPTICNQDSHISVSFPPYINPSSLPSLIPHLSLPRPWFFFPFYFSFHLRYLFIINLISFSIENTRLRTDEICSPSHCFTNISVRHKNTYHRIRSTLLQISLKYPSPILSSLTTPLYKQTF